MAKATKADPARTSYTSDEAWVAVQLIRHAPPEQRVRIVAAIPDLASAILVIWALCRESEKDQVLIHTMNQIAAQRRVPPASSPAPETKGWAP